MYTITFYSFKGGVGRTMALVNVAAELARMGRKVLLVDFDLEAPGLETFERLRPPRVCPGLVEYVSAYMHTKQIPDVRDYVYSAEAVGKNGGALWVMPAGQRDARYQAALTNLNWKKLYHDCEGFLFFEHTKQRWEEEYKPDYVLIDSRTGQTDVEGICTRQFPDAVVVLFFPNEQNLVGLQDVCARIREEKTSGLKKDIRLHFVMSNVPDLDDEDRVLRRRLEAFHKQLHISKLDAVIHRYESVALFNQALFVLDRPRSRLAREYRRLTRALIIENRADREGVLRFLHRYAQPYLPGVAREVSSEVRRKVGSKNVAFDHLDDSNISGVGFLERGHPLNKIVQHFLDDIEILIRIAECGILANEFERASGVLGRVLHLQPNLAEPLFLRAVCKTKLSQLDAAAEDLLAYLRLPDSDVMRGLKKLSDIAPSRLLEAVELLTSQTTLGDKESILPARKPRYSNELPPNLTIRGVSPVQIARLLSASECHREEFIPRAAQLLRDFIAGLSQKQKRFHWHRTSLPRALLRARCWREVIRFHELEDCAEREGDALCELALAYWGETGEIPEGHCKLALAYEEGHPEDGGGWFERNAPEVKGWLLWRVGNVPEAIKSVDRGEQTSRGSFEPVFSWWRCLTVSVAQYLDDCQQIRRMIQGDPIRPAFLAEQTTSMPPKPAN